MGCGHIVVVAVGREEHKDWPLATIGVITDLGRYTELSKISWIPQGPSLAIFEMVVVAFESLKGMLTSTAEQLTGEPSVAVHRKVCVEVLMGRVKFL